MLKEKVAQLIYIAIKEAFQKEIDQNKISIQTTRPEFEGSYTFVIFPFIRDLGGKPEDIGAKIGDYLKKTTTEVIDYNVVKGFLNLVIADQEWTKQLNQISANPNYGFFSKTDKTYMVEYSSPNTNKPLHLGHLRNIFLGYSVAEILKANGHEVVKTQVINDRGIHICKSMLAWKRFGNGETPESSSMKGDKLAGKYYVKFDQEYKKEIQELLVSGKSQENAEKEAPILVEAQKMLKKWEDNDPEVRSLWAKMNGWVYDGFNVTYKTIGVDFDELYYESDTYLRGRDEVLKGVDQGIFFKKDDGSVWVDLTSEGLDEKLLLRSDGTSVYITQDIGTAILRFKDYPKLSGQIYTVGNEQEYHFKVLFLILKKLGFKWADECFHLSYGMVDLPSGKMKSREGTVVDADDIVAEMVETAAARTKELGKIDGFSHQEAEELYHTLGLGALKYFLLKVDPTKRMLFNPEESIEFQGHTGPFIQYTHARIAAILRKAKELNISSSESTTLLKVESDLIFQLTEYPNIIKEAGANYDPSFVANYAYELAKTYNRLYNEVSIFNDEPGKTALRINLSAQTAKVLSSAMRLLGINVPERM